MCDIHSNQIKLCINIYGHGCSTCGLNFETIECIYNSNNNIITHEELLTCIEEMIKPYKKDCHILTFEKVYLYNESEKLYVAEIYLDDFPTK